MKRIGISQRVDSVATYEEQRDCLDQRWTHLALQLGFLPIPLPNAPPPLAATLIKELGLDAILLSGGNTITELAPDANDTAPARDDFEHALIDIAMSRSLPVLGICRGMQLINLHFKGQLSPLGGHVACRHKLLASSEYSGLIAEDGNSYHHWGIASGQLSPALTAIAHDEDGHIEAFIHPQQLIAGIMWHPEREQPARRLDIALMQRLLQGAPQ